MFLACRHCRLESTQLLVVSTTGFGRRRRRAPSQDLDARRVV